MKRFVIIVISFLIASVNSIAQKSLIDEYRKFNQQATKRYTDFRDECNNKYV